MDSIFDSINKNLDLFILMFLRVTALIVSSPIFGRRAIPNILKIGLCLFITYIVFASYSPKTAPEYGGVFEFAVLCIKELLFGLVVGYVTTLFFSLVNTSGEVMDMQMGFGMVNVFDVQSNISVPVTGNLFSIVMLITFFGVNGHLKLIYLLKSTFSSIPVGTATLNPTLGLVALDVFVLAFVLAINVAMPLIAAGLVGEVALGFIVRAVPQMNVFVVGIPLKIILGFMVLLLIIPVFVGFTGVIFNRMFESMDKMIMGLA
ncbi:MAG: flagellar biosynthetic protein FliR [Burkholderiales bacterium]